MSQAENAAHGKTQASEKSREFQRYAGNSVTQISLAWEDSWGQVCVLFQKQESIGPKLFTIWGQDHTQK